MVNGFEFEISTLKALSLATPDGNLLVLPPGKTIITLGFQQVYKRDRALWDITKTATTCQEDRLRVTIHP